MGFLLLILLSGNRLQASTGRSEAEFIFHQYLDSVLSPSKDTGKVRMHKYRKEIIEFYHSRKFQLAWVIHGNPIQGAWELLDEIQNCDKEGLEPREYPDQKIELLLRQGKRYYFWRLPLESNKAAELDLLLTETYLTFSNHLLFGRSQPRTMEDAWHVSAEVVNLPTYLQKTISDQKGISESLRQIVPQQPEYGKMKYWLAVYRQRLSKGEWPIVTSLPAASKSSSVSGPIAKVLCLRLQAEGFFAAGDCPDSLSSELVEAIKHFQSTHGVDSTGQLDAATLREINVPLRERIEQLKLNIDCWRWLPQNLGERHIRINIADFRLKAYEHGLETFSMRVVVGRKSDSTPVFSDRAIAVTLNPAWNVPASIARDEMLPALKKDPRYLEKHDMELLADWTKEETLLRADSIDWDKIDTAHFTFRIRQKYGESSALGRVKINLTNPFNIYLHDTPSKQYFEKEKRALSHGCVRVENPLKLAIWLFGPGTSWDQPHLETLIQKGEPYTIAMAEPGIPVHILYRTAFIDSEGGLQFRPDIYGWDKRLGADLVSKIVVP